MRFATIAACVVIVGVFPQKAMPQAGSIGGAAVKSDKSDSGSNAPSDHATSQRKPKKAIVDRTSAEPPRTSRCTSVVGSWLWIVAGTTYHATFRSDHTATHTAGGNGQWSCEGGLYTVTWTLDRTDRFTVSADGSTFSGISSVMGLPLLGKRITSSAE
jgi:hypothetical protein